MRKENNIYFDSLKKLRDVRYKDKNFFSNRFYDAFKKSRNIIKKKEINRNKKSFTFAKDDFLLKKLKLIANNTGKNNKLLLNIMKKFEINLILRKSYDNQLKKKTNQETNPLSYLLLSFLIIKLKELDDLQKLNFILKINDYLIFKLYYEKKTFPKFVLKKLFRLINIEAKIIKKYET